MRESLASTADLLDRVSRALRQRPVTLPVEGVGRWLEVRKQSGVLTQKYWPDFDSLKSLIESAQEAQGKEEAVWQQLPQSDQDLLKRS